MVEHLLIGLFAAVLIHSAQMLHFDSMEEIKRPTYTPYVCRHTFITNAIKGGMDLPVLEAIVGHVDRETTRIYTHLRADDLVGAVQSLNSPKVAVCNTSVTSKKAVKQKSRKSS